MSPKLLPEKHHKSSDSKHQHSKGTNAKNAGSHNPESPSAVHPVVAGKRVIRAVSVICEGCIFNKFAMYLVKWLEYG